MLSDSEIGQLFMPNKPILWLLAIYKQNGWVAPRNTRVGLEGGDRCSVVPNNTNPLFNSSLTLTPCSSQLSHSYRCVSPSQGCQGIWGANRQKRTEYKWTNFTIMWSFFSFSPHSLSCAVLWLACHLQTGIKLRKVVPRRAHSVIFGMSLKLMSYSV